MKKYIISVLLVTCAINSVAQTQMTDKSKIVSADGVLQTRKELKLSKSVEKQLIMMLLSISKVDLKTLLLNKKITADEIYDLSEKPTTTDEQALLLKLSQLVENNQLRPAIEKALADLTLKSASVPQLKILKTLSAEKKDFAISSIENTVLTILQLRGLNNKNITYTEWQDLSATISKQLDQTNSNEDILQFAQVKWSTYNDILPLINGTASFTKREELIQNAKKSIDVLTWSIYDDLTGRSAADLLIQMKNKNVQVRVIVDGQIAMTPGHRDEVAKLQANGVEVIRWLNPLLPFQGQHRKMIIVDKKHVIAGGMNFGDVYSHKNPDLTVPRWRDTDIYFNGQSALEAANLFAKIWNEQIDFGTAKYAKIAKTPIRTNHTVNSNNRIALINHNPTEVKQSGSTIILTLLKAIRQAKESVDIENAYIILFPALKTEIQQALSRHIKVRVLTNSTESVDEPVVSVPILRSAKQLVDVGADVYLKKGFTLHSKFAIVDKKYSLIMSYNLHPRSEKIEGEMMALVDDTDFASKMTEVFESDISTNKAVYLNTDKDVGSLDNLGAIPSLRIFFDLL